MSPSVKLDDVIEALESASDEHAYYFDNRTGKIVLVTDEDMKAAEEDDIISEYPDWQRESILKARAVLRSPEAFLELPDQFDIYEYKMMEEFCRQLEDRQAGQEMLRLIKGSGAFRRFKNAINEMDIDKEWYEFKRSALEEIAIEWLDEHKVPYSRDDTTDVSEAIM